MEDEEVSKSQSVPHPFASKMDNHIILIPSISFSPRTSTQQLRFVNHVYVLSWMLVSALLIVSRAPLTAAKARPLELFGTDTVDMRFSAEENWNRCQIVNPGAALA